MTVGSWPDSAGLAEVRVLAASIQMGLMREFGVGLSFVITCESCLSAGWGANGLSTARYFSYTTSDLCGKAAHVQIG
jgi:hypothetical protein